VGSPGGDGSAQIKVEQCVALCCTGGLRLETDQSVQVTMRPVIETGFVPTTSLDPPSYPGGYLVPLDAHAAGSLHYRLYGVSSEIYRAGGNRVTMYTP
jgi:hypothetical protein